MITLVGQLFKFMWVYQKFWMAPLIFIIIGLGSLLMVAKTSVITPFLYAIF
jgi:hypothetical protein